MKYIYCTLIVLLTIAFIGMVVTAIVNTNKALDRGAAAIASADQFLARYEGRH